MKTRDLIKNLREHYGDVLSAHHLVSEAINELERLNEIELEFNETAKARDSLEIELSALHMKLAMIATGNYRGDVQEFVRSSVDQGT